MGRRTTSLREQGIEDIVGLVFPSLAQAALGLREPGGAFGIGVHRLDGDAHMGMLGQREGLERTQQPVFVDGFDGGDHGRSLVFPEGLGKGIRLTYKPASSKVGIFAT